ncbi:hypothetical protein [Lentzea sp. NPDC092896]|uniref:hypothetical protein n=1 Tax=Lentzea sp. NPDC092896 TaxID=3364127 RepID=UPI0038249CAF
MTQVWYCTREDVKHATAAEETVWNNRQIDRAIAAGTEAVESLTHRRFYPEFATRYFDWPNEQDATPWRLWLNQHELIEVTTLEVAGVALSPNDFFLYPQGGPPYNRVEINLAGSAAFSGGATHQRAIGIAGLFGHSAKQAPAGVLAEGLDASETTVDVSDSAAIGVGQLIKVGSERMQVTGKAMLDTGQTLQAVMPSEDNHEMCVVSNGAAYSMGETILVDAEKMLIQEIAGNTLIVERAYDASTLAAHTGSTIYAPRTLTVERGVLGTTAAEHAISTAIVKHVPPSLARDLCIAEAQNTLYQEASGYARQIGRGETAREVFARALRDLRSQVYDSLGRHSRMRTVV